MKKIISILKYIWILLKKIEIIDKDTLQIYYLDNYNEYLLLSRWLERIPYDKKSFFILKINNLFLLMDNKNLEFSCLSKGAFILSHPFGSPFIIDSFESPLFNLKKPWEDISPKEILIKKNLDNKLDKELNNLDNKLDKELNNLDYISNK